MVAAISNVAAHESPLRRRWQPRSSPRRAAAAAAPGWSPNSRRPRFRERSTKSRSRLRQGPSASEWRSARCGGPGIACQRRPFEGSMLPEPGQQQRRRIRNGNRGSPRQSCSVADVARTVAAADPAGRLRIDDEPAHVDRQGPGPRCVAPRSNSAQPRLSKSEARAAALGSSLRGAGRARSRPVGRISSVRVRGPSRDCPDPTTTHSMLSEVLRAAARPGSRRSASRPRLQATLDRSLGQAQRPGGLLDHAFPRCRPGTAPYGSVG